MEIFFDLSKETAVLCETASKCYRYPPLLLLFSPSLGTGTYVSKHHECTAVGILLAL